MQWILCRLKNKKASEIFPRAVTAATAAAAHMNISRFLSTITRQKLDGTKIRANGFFKQELHGIPFALQLRMGIARECCKRSKHSISLFHLPSRDEQAVKLQTLWTLAAAPVPCEGQNRTVHPIGHGTSFQGIPWRLCRRCLPTGWLVRVT